MFTLKHYNCLLIEENSFFVKAREFAITAYFFQATLASGIDVGQGINVGPGKFDKKNKRRALNKHVLCSK